MGLAYAIQWLFGLEAPLALSPVACLAVSALPAVVWLVYFRTQDRYEPAPKHYLVGVYLLGAVVVAPLSAFVLDEILRVSPSELGSLNQFGGDRLVRAFLVVGLGQELCKYLAVRYTIYRSAAFDEPMDGIIYASAAGIGFATYHSYELLAARQGQVFFAQALGYAVVATLAHACFASVLGLALGWAKFSARSLLRRQLTLVTGILAAAALNGQFQVLHGAVTSAGLQIHAWRGVAFAAGFVTTVFFVTSLLVRWLLAPKALPSEAEPHLGPGDLGAAISPRRAPADGPAAPRPADGLSRSERLRRLVRRDAAVVLAATGLLLVGTLGYHSLVPLPITRFEQYGLEFEGPGEWLPPDAISPAPERLLPAAPQPAHVNQRGKLPYHVAYTSLRNPDKRLEVQIAARPRFGNLRAFLAYERRRRYGELYRTLDSQERTVGGRDWLETRFEYAYKPTPEGSPWTATGIEYASLSDERLYVVTMHGSRENAAELAARVAPTLAIPAGTSRRQVAPLAGASRAQVEDPVVANALPSVVLILLLDEVKSRLAPVASGSGTIVAANGSILTNRHVLYDQNRQRFHDRFVVGRFRGLEREPELVCGGDPSRALVQAEVDLALIRCDLDMDGKPFAPSDWPAVAFDLAYQVRLDEKLWIIGYPEGAGGAIGVSKGYVSGSTRESGGAGTALIKTTASFGAGYSGGAAMDEKGLFAGVPTGYRVVTQTSGEAVVPLGNVGLIRPLELARDLLAGYAGPGPGTADEADRAPRWRGGPGKGPPGVLVSARVLEAANGQPIAKAVVLVLRQNVTAAEIDLYSLREQALTWGRTDSDGRVTLQQRLPRGHRYTVAALARGFAPVLADGALLLGQDTPDYLELWPYIELERR